MIQKMPRAEPSTTPPTLVSTTASVHAAGGRSSDQDSAAQLNANQSLEVQVQVQRGLAAGCDEVAAWLETHGLDEYTVPMIEAGYTRLVLFAGMDDLEMDSVISKNKMPYPHARAFKAAVQQMLPQAAASIVKQPQTTGSFAVDETLDTGLLASVPVVVHAVPLHVPKPPGTSEMAGEQILEREQRAVRTCNLRVEEQAGMSEVDDDSAHHVDNRLLARRWLYLMLCGAVVQQAGWWPLYGDLVLWGSITGGTLVLVGAIGFDCCTLGHLASWGSGPRTGFWILIVFWTVYCVGTGFANRENVRILAGCGLIWPCAGLIVMCEEIGRMQAAPNYRCSQPSRQQTCAATSEGGPSRIHDTISV